MMHINKLISNAYEFQIFHLDDSTNIEKIDRVNQSYLMSARFFPLNGENQRQCEEIINTCANDIIEHFHSIIKDNDLFYKHFTFKDKFSHTSISAYRDNGVEKINFIEVFYHTELR